MIPKAFHPFRQDIQGIELPLQFTYPFHTLLQAGVRKENIEITDICTCENSDYLFSHRASNGKRGNLGAFLMMEE